MPIHKDFEEHHYIRDDPVITQATVVTAEPKPVVHKQDTKVHEDVKHEGDAHHVPSDWNIDVDTYDIAIPTVVEHVDHYPVTVHHETPIHHEIFDEDPLYYEDFPHEKLVVHQAPVVHSTVIHQTEVHHVDDDPHATHDSYDTTPIPPEVLKHYTHAQKQEEPKAATPAEPKAEDTDKKEIKKEEEPKELRFEDKHSVPDAWQVDV